MGSDLNFEDIRRFWILRTVLETGSLASAARKLKVTTSAVSQSLSHLEKNLGGRAVIREKGNFRATATAQQILKTLEPAFTALNSVLEKSKPALPEMSWLTLGAYESLAVDLAPGLIERLKTLMPGLKLNVQIARSGALLTKLRKSDLCMALIAEIDGLEDFRTKIIYEDTLGLFWGGKDARIPQTSTETQELITKLGLGILAAGPEGYPRYYSQYLKQFGKEVPIKMSSESLEALSRCAAAGVFAAVLPKRVGLRQGSGLFELTYSEKSQGNHKIYLVSHKNCDTAEFDFVYSEIMLTLG